MDQQVHLPKYDFKISDALITNFHTPQSTLLMLSSAFGGYDLVSGAYNEAMKEKYLLRIRRRAVDSISFRASLCMHLQIFCGALAVDERTSSKTNGY